jgi:pimeloyl-ACP methyl ester carboxylesterase
VASFIETLGIGKVALVGHGLGSLVAITFASQNPAMVDRLLATGVPETPAALHSRIRLTPAVELAEWLFGRGTVAEAAKKEATKTDAQAILLSLDDLSMLDLPRLANTLACPALFVYGGDDPAMPVPANGTLDALPASTHAIVFSASAHFPMLDEPSQYNRLLIDFLSLPSGESPRQLQLKEEWKRRVR